GTPVHPEFVKIPPLCFCAPETRRMLLKLRGTLCVLDQGHAPGEETNHLEGEFLNEAQNCGYTHAFCICVMGRGTDLDCIGAPTRRSGGNGTADDRRHRYGSTIGYQWLWNRSMVEAHPR